MAYATIKVMDQNGIVYKSIREAGRVWGLNNKRMFNNLRDSGVYVSQDGKVILRRWEEGMKAPVLPTAAPVQAPATADPLMARLKEIYTDEELKMLASGEGIEKRRIIFPEVCLEGNHHRIVVISDSHIGSIYSPEVWMEEVADYCNSHEVDCVLHAGDVTEGLKIGRTGTQIYELSQVGYDAQKEKAIELLSLFNVPIYAISGNHDAYFQEYHGADIVKAIADEVPNMTYVGNNRADIEIDGITLRLFHGNDGSSYALSYRLQKLCESYTGGKKPEILIAGHVHKFCYIFERNIHAISAPCMQMQTSFMEGRKLAAHTGFLQVDFETNQGEVSNLSVKYFPFYA